MDNILDTVMKISLIVMIPCTTLLVIAGTIIVLNLAFGLI